MFANWCDGCMDFLRVHRFTISGIFPIMYTNEWISMSKSPTGMSIVNLNFIYS